MSLLSGVDTSQQASEPTTEQPNIETTVSQTEENANYNFFWSEGNGSEDEKPEWFKSDKYGSVADQAKAYIDLESKFGGFTGAPEQYEMTASEEVGQMLKEAGLDYSSSEDPYFKHMSEVAKNANMSQDSFNQFVDEHIKFQIESEKFSKQKELEKLGENAPARLTKLGAWAQKELGDAYPDFEDACNSAAVVRTMEAIMNKMQGEPAVLGSKAVHKTSSYSLDDIRRMQRDPEFRKDKAHQEKVRGLYEAYYKANPQDG